MPFVQLVPAPHIWPQVPQLLLSVSGFEQLPLQFCSDDWQQTCELPCVAQTFVVAVQSVPHTPVVAPHVVFAPGATHAPLHSTVPAPQHLPFEQVSPFAVSQTSTPQPPQFALSVSGFEHVPPQLLNPVVQHLGKSFVVLRTVHVSPLLQAVVHEPQCISSVLRSKHCWPELVVHTVLLGPQHVPLSQVSPVRHVVVHEPQ